MKRGPEAILARIGATIIVSLLMMSAAAAAERSYRFDIVDQTLSQALRNYGQISGQQIIFTEDLVANVAHISLKGDYTAQGALQRLLQGTGLVAKRSPSGALMVQREQSSTARADSVQNAAGAGPVNAMPSGESVSPDDEDKLSEVLVTGSRIPIIAGQTTATPVYSISAEELKSYGVSSLQDIRRVIPQLGPNTAGNEQNTLIGSGPSPGLANRTTLSLGGLNLANYNLGGVTLILVDGRRLAKSGQAFAGLGNLEDYDLNGIPFDAIERIDVLTGGASAIYGADAMAGVVNIILKKDFSRDYAAVSLRDDDTFSGSAPNKMITVSAGLHRDQFHISTVFNYQDVGAFARRDRWFTATDNLTQFGGQYDNRNSYVGAVSSLDGSNLPGLSSATGQIPAGSRGTATPAQFAAAGTPAIYDSGSYLNNIDPNRTRSILLNAGYDFAPSFNLYSQIRWNEKKTYSPLIPYVGFYDAADDFGSGLTVPAGVAGNTFGVDVSLNKQFFDLAQTSVSTSRNPSFTVGADGDFHAWTTWHYDAYFSWAQSEQDYDGFYNGDGLDDSKLAAAFAAGTAPILIYDSQSGNPNPPGVLQSYLDRTSTREKDDTLSANVSARGSPFSLPAGDVQLVFGGEWLSDRAKFSADSQNLLNGLGLSGKISRDDRSVFAETNIPLLSAKQRVQLIDDLELNLSIRHDSYSDVGGATTPRIAVVFRPVPWLTVRASRSQGFKPVALWDLYAPYYVIPYPLEVGPGTEYPLTDPLRNNESLMGSINEYEVGHRNLKPTTSTSKSIGFVFAPPLIEHLTLAADYTKTDIKNALGSIDYQTVINYYPSYVMRAPSSDGLPGQITAIDTSAVNTSAYQTQSLTYTLSWQRVLPWGEFGFQGTYTDPTVTRAQDTAISPIRNAYLPKRVSATAIWRRHAIGASVSSIYQGAFNLYPDELPYIDDSFASYIEWNTRVSYEFDNDPRFAGGQNSLWGTLLEHVLIAASVVNAFDHGPSRAVAGSGNLPEDTRGRRYVLDLSKRF